MKTARDVMQEYGMHQDDIDAVLRLPSGHAIIDYLAFGYEPGGFVKSVLSNDLFGAFARADSTNKQMIETYCRVIYNHIPSGSWGSPEKVEKWMRSRREEIMKETD